MSIENALAPDQLAVTPDGSAPPPPLPMPEATAPVPAPPPAMPEPEPEPQAGAQPAAAATTTATTTATTMAAPTEQKAGGWEVDPYRLRAFGDAVVRARSYLDAVRMKVERMQGEEFTPQLGTSPVGQQLAKKFDDRLNAEHGLRAMLAEAMARMEKFVTSAEEAAKVYEEVEQNTKDTFDHHERDKRG